jgi:hypothetical protein
MAGSSSSSPDMTLINMLFDVIESHPPAIEARVLLMQQWINAGLLDAAEDTAKELLRFDPSNAEAQSFLHSSQNNGAWQNPGPTGSSTQPNATSIKNEPRAPPKPGPLPRTPEQRTTMERELSEGYEALRARAKVLVQESRLVQDLQQREHISTEPKNHIQNLKALADGRISAVVSTPTPCSARAVARAMEADRTRALDIAVVDFADVVRWRRSSTVGIDNDSLREALVKRALVIAAALPDDLAKVPSTALMHVEHEELERTYVNDQTMLLDPIADIPRPNFWISEDGYAWDMDELARSIASNGGVMRNPLSHQMFSADDVRAIVQHSFGRRLEALRIEQSSLSRGVRPATIVKLDQLSATLLGDLSDDQVPSRLALDDFLRYIATLPPAEQRAIDALRVPATDSHTGQAFDCTIGEAVSDGNANRICLHKTGDLIGQAARYLRQSNNT